MHRIVIIDNTIVLWTPNFLRDSILIIPTPKKKW